MSPIPSGSQDDKTYIVRLAALEDAEEIAVTYNQGIDEGMATFETTHRSAQEIRERLLEKGDRFPTIVVVRNEKLVAWASAGPYRTRECYSGVAEHSVYVHRDARHGGNGRLVLTSFLDEYRRRGFWKIVSRIFPENTASLALHRAVGFRVVGIYEKHGKAGSRWRDCVIVEKLLPIDDPDREA